MIRSCSRDYTITQNPPQYNGASNTIRHDGGCMLHWEDNEARCDGETFTVSRHGITGDHKSGCEWLCTFEPGCREKTAMHCFGTCHNDRGYGRQSAESPNAGVTAYVWLKGTPRVPATTVTTSTETTTTTTDTVVQALVRKNLDAVPALLEAHIEKLDAKFTKGLAALSAQVAKDRAMDVAQVNELDTILSDAVASDRRRIGRLEQLAANLTSRLDRLEAAFAEFKVRPAVPGGASTGASTAVVAPEISSTEDGGMQIAAPSGKITFSTDLN